MAFQITSEGDMSVSEEGKFDLPDNDEALESLLPPDSPPPSLPLDHDVVLPVDSLLTMDTMGSGDAPSHGLLVCPPTLTAKDVQDMILPDPSIVNLLPPLEMGDFDSASNDVFSPSFLSQIKDRNNQKESAEGSDDTIRLTGKDIMDIQELNRDPAEESEVKFDIRKAAVLFRCEMCQEMPMPSGTVHTCEFGHQVCGYCYDNGVRQCVVCKGHLSGHNVPLERILERLRERYGEMFNHLPPIKPDVQEQEGVSRFHSFKPIECPEDGCKCQSSIRSLPTHFRTEHKHVPTVDLPLFKPTMVLLHERYFENVNGNVIAVVNLKITDEEICSGMFSDVMTCWVQCGAIDMGEGKALAVWVSCAYEEAQMPPILYNVRVSTTDGYSSFGGQMIPLHDYTDPRSVLNDGKCLLLLPHTLQDSASDTESGLIVEVKFYPR